MTNVLDQIRQLADAFGEADTARFSGIEIANMLTEALTPAPSEIHTEVTEYTVTCLPPGHPERGHFSITVARRGPDSWALVRHAMCWSETVNAWEYEVQSSSRTDEWITEHRYPLAEALEIAERLAPGLTVNGYTVPIMLTPLWSER